MPSSRPTLVVALATLVLTSTADAQAAATLPGPVVQIIAPTGATQREARRLLRLCRWYETSVTKDADALLVVVRSSSPEPLERSYQSLKWLRDRADSQLNESGSLYHVLMYSIRDPDRFDLLSHQTYTAEPGSDVNGSLVDQRLPSVPGLQCGL